MWITSPGVIAFEQAYARVFHGELLEPLLESLPEGSI
jgi:hypothetical protein